MEWKMEVHQSTTLFENRKKSSNENVRNQCHFSLKTKLGLIVNNTKCAQIRNCCMLCMLCCVPLCFIVFNCVLPLHSVSVSKTDDSLSGVKILNVNTNLFLIRAVIMLIDDLIINVYRCVRIYHALLLPRPPCNQNQYYPSQSSARSDGAQVYGSAL